MKIKSMPNYCVARPKELELTKSKSGIIIPMGEKKRGRLESVQHGVIVDIKFKSVKDEDDHGVKIGDTVVYGEFAGFESDIDMVRYRFIKIEDLRAILIDE